MELRKSKGPKQLSCDTPYITGNDSEVSPRTETHCCLFCR